MAEIDMPHDLERIAGFFWKYPENWNGWRLAFESSKKKSLLMKAIIEALPYEWGAVEFEREFGDGKLIVLLRRFRTLCG